MWVVLSWFYGPLKCVHPFTLLGTEGERAFSLYSVANWLTNNNASKSGPQTSFTLYSLQITMSSINIIRILPNLICQLVHWEWINKWIQKTFGQPSYWQFVKLLWGTSYCATSKVWYGLTLTNQNADGKIFTNSLMWFLLHVCRSCTVT